MDFKGLLEFIDSGVETWKKVKQDLSPHNETTALLNKAYPVVMFDHLQLDLNTARNLYMKTRYLQPENPVPEELQREKLRKKMLTHFEKRLQKVFFEIRFLSLNIELIEIVKAHPLIKELSQHGRASIRVIVKECDAVKRTD